MWQSLVKSDLFCIVVSCWPIYIYVALCLWVVDLYVWIYCCEFLTYLYVSWWDVDLYICIVVSAAVVNNYLLCPSTNSHYSPNMGEIFTLNKELNILRYPVQEIQNTKLTQPKFSKLTQPTSTMVAKRFCSLQSRAAIWGYQVTNPKIDQFSCHLCSSTFNNQDKLMKHQQNWHFNRGHPKNGAKE